MEESVHTRAKHTVNEKQVISICGSSLEYPKYVISLVSTPSQESCPEETGQNLLK